MALMDLSETVWTQEQATENLNWQEIALTLLDLKPLK